MLERDYEPKRHKGTRGAEGLTRLAFSVDDVYRMVEAGIIHEDDRVELVDGELVPMSPKGSQHEVVRNTLSTYLARITGPEVSLAFETTYRFNDNTYLEPDIVLYWSATPFSRLAPENTILVIEVADTSLRYDTGRKAALYARFGIEELWVIDAAKRTTRIFRQPGGDGYKSIEDKSPDEPLVPDAVPLLSVTLSKLDLR